MKGLSGRIFNISVPIFLSHTRNKPALSFLAHSQLFRTHFLFSFIFFVFTLAQFQFQSSIVSSIIRYYSSNFVAKKLEGFCVYRLMKVKRCVQC
ncbi:unnamed protein product [Lathyrus oleraceus]